MIDQGNVQKNAERMREIRTKIAIAIPIGPRRDLVILSLLLAHMVTAAMRIRLSVCAQVQFQGGANPDRDECPGLATILPGFVCVLCERKRLLSFVLRRGTATGSQPSPQ